MIRRAVQSMFRRRVELQDDHATLNLQFRIGRRTIRVALQSTRTDGQRGGGFFTRRAPTRPQGFGFGSDALFDDESLDVDEDGYVELPDGTHIHVADPRLPQVLSQLRL